MSENTNIIEPREILLRQAAKIRVKAQMLCCGVDAPRPLRDKIAYEFGLQKGFIHGTVFMLDGTDPVNTSFLDSTSGSRAPVTLHDDAIPYVMTGGYKFDCPPIRHPAILNSSMNDVSIADYFSLHSPHTLFTTPTRQCIFITIGKPCTFCTFEGGKIVRLKPVQFREILSRILSEVPEINSLAIGGGTPNLSDHGARYYSELGSIAKELGLDVSIEMVPPHKIEDLGRIFDAGVDSLIMSIEIWDDEVRREVCLGKGTVTKGHYMEAWAAGVAALGRGNVTSVLLAGLEPIESSITGATVLIESGVIPALIPFRAYGGIPLSNLDPISVNDYLRLSAECGRMLRLSGLDPRNQLGCTECGGCSLEIAAFLDRV